MQEDAEFVANKLRWRPPCKGAYYTYINNREREREGASITSKSCQVEKNITGPKESPSILALVNRHHPHARLLAFLVSGCCLGPPAGPERGGAAAL